MQSTTNKQTKRWYLTSQVQSGRLCESDRSCLKSETAKVILNSLDRSLSLMTVQFELDPSIEPVAIFYLLWNYYKRSLKSLSSLNMSEMRLKLKPKSFGSEYGRKFQELFAGILWGISSLCSSFSHLVDAAIMMNEKRVENFILFRFKILKFWDHGGLYSKVFTVTFSPIPTVGVWLMLELLEPNLFLNLSILYFWLKFRNSVK